MTNVGAIGVTADIRTERSKRRTTQCGLTAKPRLQPGLIARSSRNRISSSLLVSEITKRPGHGWRCRHSPRACGSRPWCQSCSCRRRGRGAGRRGRKEPEHFGEAAGGEAVVAANARTLLEMDGRGEAMRGEHLVRDHERLLEADWPAQAVPANLQEDLVGDVVVRGAEHLGEDLRKGTRLSVNVDRL